MDGHLTRGTAVGMSEPQSYGRVNRLLLISLWIAAAGIHRLPQESTSDTAHSRCAWRMVASLLGVACIATAPNCAVRRDAGLGGVCTICRRASARSGGSASTRCRVRLAARRRLRCHRIPVITEHEASQTMNTISKWMMRTAALWAVSKACSWPTTACANVKGETQSRATTVHTTPDSIPH